MGEKRITVQELIDLLVKFNTSSEICFSSNTGNFNFYEITERPLDAGTPPLLILGIK